VENVLLLWWDCEDRKEGLGRVEGVIRRAEKDERRGVRRRKSGVDIVGGPAIVRIVVELGVRCDVWFVDELQHKFRDGAFESRERHGTVTVKCNDLERSHSDDVPVLARRGLHRGLSFEEVCL
jgi:hypothetical protein